MRMKKQSAASTSEYETYLRLSDFDTGMAGKLNYYVVGYLAGMGRKRRAAQQDIWQELHSLAYVGMCENAKDLKQYETAIQHCRRALRYDPSDPFAHYLLGLSYTYQAELTGSLELLAAAKRSFRNMLDINPDLKEAAYAKANLEEIDRALRAP
jgi:tetratricopeptide (TPR) repeat protein